MGSWNVQDAGEGLKEGAACGCFLLSAYIDTYGGPSLSEVVDAGLRILPMEQMTSILLLG